MYNKKILIAGYGSIAKKHHISLRKLVSDENIYIFSRRKLKFKNAIYEFKEIKEINPDYIIICVETSLHYNYLKKFNQVFTNKIILVEKPLFTKFIRLKKIKNKIFIGYNLRFHPIIIYLKKYLINKKIFNISVEAQSYLPFWRKNIDYKKNYSANKNKGGGVLFDLSHEIDYLIWFFGKLNINFVINNKISNLKINTDDYLFLNLKTKKINVINLTLSYISRIAKRNIHINGVNFSLIADLLNNKIILFLNNKKKLINFKSTECNTNYFLNKNILEKKFSNVATYENGLEVMNHIERIKNFNK